MPELIISGDCDPQFASVKQAFVNNFSEHQEVGAAVSVYVNNQKVVDLWGGYFDANCQRPLTRDALFTVWSLGKAMAALCVLRLVDAGRLNLHDPVCQHWPEFGQNGKAQISVAQLLSHQAGLVAIDTHLSEGAWNDWALFVSALERQKPWWQGNQRHGYHVHTYGFLLGELIRRVDGRNIAQFMQQEIAEPLDIDFYYGVNDAQLTRIADNILYHKPAKEYAVMDVNAEQLGELSQDERMRYLTYNNPQFSYDGEFGVNSKTWRKAQFPSTSPQSNARALAKIFSALANDGSIDGKQILSPGLIDKAITIMADGEDAVMTKPTRFGLGFMLTMPERPLGPNPRTFGHYGNAGLLGFADPDAKLSFCYTMNRQGRAWRDPRNIALVDALYDSINNFK